MDPTTQTLLAWVFSFLPQPYDTYVASAIGAAATLSFLSSAFSAAVKPPSASSAKWLQTAYKVLAFPAIGFGWARKAVVPGMPHLVQLAARESAKLAAAVPETTVIAVPPSAEGAIVPLSSAVASSNKTSL